MREVKKTEKAVAGILCAVLTALMLTVLVCMAATALKSRFGWTNPLTEKLLAHLPIQAQWADPVWEEKYPFHTTFTEQYVSKIKKLERTITNYCTSCFPGKQKVNWLVSQYKAKVLHYTLDPYGGEYGSANYVEEPADNVTAFSEYLSDRGIPFLYVQTPSRNTVEYHVGITGADGIAQRSEVLTERLEQNGVPVLDLIKETYDSHIYHFDKTEHWYPEDALFAAGKIAERINRLYHLGLELSVYDEENYLDLLDSVPDTKRQVRALYEHPYRLLSPKDDGWYTLTYAEEDRWEGGFSETLLTSPDTWRCEEAATYHMMYRIFNSLVYTTEHPDAPSQKRIVVIGDSFNWPVASYLAAGWRWVDVIHNASFSGSIKSYIESVQPDMVLICYNDAELYPEYTEPAYDLE